MSLHEYNRSYGYYIILQTLCHPFLQNYFSYKLRAGEQGVAFISHMNEGEFPQLFLNENRYQDFLYDYQEYVRSCGPNEGTDI